MQTYGSTFDVTDNVLENKKLMWYLLKVAFEFSGKIRYLIVLLMVSFSGWIVVLREKWNIVKDIYSLYILLFPRISNGNVE